MSELIEKLGLDWRLLAAQLVNFVIILAVLRLTLYKPLLKVLRERREKIAKGVADARVAAQQLAAADAVKAQKVAEAEQEALRVLEASEKRAKARAEELLAVTRAKEGQILENAERVAQAKGEEAAAAFYRSAGELVKLGLARVAKMKPSLIDEPLIAEAVNAMREVTKR
ncbi:MAG: hypothetical protein HY536_01435 [Candidatus Colwellbacteria bacterium]|nr:hypothetical protein [Candidatus Colwellbacteria bacterium]